MFLPLSSGGKKVPEQAVVSGEGHLLLHLRVEEWNQMHAKPAKYLGGASFITNPSLQQLIWLEESKNSLPEKDINCALCLNHLFF
jgi:hypothetical protein